ncbi:GNAT family N-acetyltransferase [Ammoniphilus sp. CFH 90114]|uniref:GNAT family N-acetyltransferase n=1 Tax=Ammoniphilus sp. CFH 90114 TaxID=2493665 RepID=UPI00100E14EF|nr:GNAT family N-acetyltransferase [Ammoniphilus sp. CFH 90114]RXT06499.1 GNAT family N-acetyltransferase [Ammoniphilus sp. CFH 90114]
MTVINSTVNLDFYCEAYLPALLSFTLPKEQVMFTALPEVLLQLAREDTTRIPIVILDQGRPVGMFALQSGPRVLEYTDNPRALLLTAFSINYNEQGKGYAKLALLSLPLFVIKNFTEIDEIVLVVNGKNTTAQQLYLKAGFTDRGGRKMGEIGEQYVLHLPI